MSSIPIVGTNAAGIMTLAVPSRPATSSAARHKAYVSAGTTGAALFIDGALLPAGTASSCTSTCTIAWSAALAVPASHSFAVEIDNGTNVLAEGVKTYPIVVGNNGSLAMMTLNGVAASGAFSNETCTMSSCSGTLTVADASGNTIVNTSTPIATAFDNGPLTYASTASTVGAVTSGAAIAQPSTAGTSPYTVSCTTSSNYFQTTLSPRNTTGSGIITPSELVARALAYPATIAYSSSAYTCLTGMAITRARLYFSAGNSIVIYALGASGNAPPLATIIGSNTGLNTPEGIAFDSSGRLYVANFNGNNIVTIYGANPLRSGTLNESPVATISGASSGLSYPIYITLDSAGHVYVSNSGGGISIYAADPVGNVMSDVAFIPGINSDICASTGIAVDVTGRVFLGNTCGYNPVAIFAPPIGTMNEPLSAYLTGSTPYGIAFDSLGRLFVAETGSSSVNIYAPNLMGNGTSTPVATIGGGSTGINFPGAIAIDAYDRLFIGDAATNRVSVFAAAPSGAVTTAPLTSLNVNSIAIGIAIQ